MRVIAIVNQKGGVAKTTTAGNLAAGLARRGKRVLAVDLDSQANLTTWIGAREEEEGAPRLRLYEAMSSWLQLEREDPGAGNPMLESIAPSVIDGVSLLYGSSASAKLETVLEHDEAPATSVARMLKPLLPRYDVIIIDTPPGIGRLQLAAMVAASEVIVPIKASRFAVAGMKHVKDTIETLTRKGIMTRPPRVRVLVTMYSDRVGVQKAHVELVRAANIAMFETKIRVNTRLEECVGHRKSIFEYAPTANGSVDYDAFIAEVA